MVDTDADDRVPAPSWPTCAHRGEGADRPCNGRQADGFDHCLAHLEPSQLSQVLQRLSPGADLDASGTNINAELLERILCAVAREGEPPKFGDVHLDQAHFAGGVDFKNAQFSGDASFFGAQFSQYVNFTSAQFSGDASFSGAQFSQYAFFTDAQFSGDASFFGAQFTGSASFSGAEFRARASFHDSQFNQELRFTSAQFNRDAWFHGAKFARNAEFDRTQFRGDAWFAHTQFSGRASFQRAQFSEDATFFSAQFSEDVNFAVVEFGKDAMFGGAHFSQDAMFNHVHIGRNASYFNAQFAKAAYFYGVQVSGSALFFGAQFSGNARFDFAQFRRDSMFNHAQFSGEAGFSGAQFSNDADFTNARFESARSFGPLVAGNLILREAVFVRPVVLQVAAGLVACTDTTWELGVTMRVRYARIDLERAAFTVPSFVAGADRQLAASYLDANRYSQTQLLDESELESHLSKDHLESIDRWMPAVSSLRGTDAFNLTVTDVDLSQCRFAGARLLDQLRLEGRCIFDHPPEGPHTGWAWSPAWRWSSRQSLAEERIWRATTPKFTGWAKNRNKETAELHPERLAGLYRQLRKAQEDAKNEPGAADFYYGEMEMRRHARTTPAAERGIIWLYWVISGYGLRALRSLAALGIVGVIVTTALVGWGLATRAPTQQLTGTITTTPQNPARIDATLHTTPPELPPASQRWTGQRTRTALQITLESIVFRSTDKPLTPAGTWTTIAARILGPVLLALALLAARNRVKR